MSVQSPQAYPTGTDRQDLTRDFQAVVGQYLIRHRSILDIMSKLQEASSRVQRALAKAVTVCGCVQIRAERQQVPEGIDYAELKQYVQTHLDGQLCEQCHEVLEIELGQTLFYITAVCDILGLQATDVLRQEKQRLETLGVYNLT